MAQGAARSRLATRESFFGGPLSTRDFCKAPNWQDLVKQESQARVTPPPAVKRDVGAAKAVQRAAGPLREPTPDPELVRKQKLKKRRDFSGLNDDDIATSSGGEGVAQIKPVGRPRLLGQPVKDGAAAAAAAAGGGSSRLAAGNRRSASATHNAANSDLGARFGPASRTGTPGAGPSRVTGGQAGAIGTARGASATAAAARNGTPERRPATAPAPAGRPHGANSRATAGGAAGGRPSNTVVVVRGGQGKGQKGSGSRKLAMEPMAVGKGRKQLANEALQARCDALRAEGSKSPAPAQLPKQPAAAAGAAARPATSAAPSPSSAAATAAAAAAAARKAREAAAAKATMQKQHQKTGLGMQTQLLITRPPGQQQQQQPGQAAAKGGRVTLDQLSPQQLQQLKEEFMRKRRLSLATGGGARAGASSGGGGAGPQGRGSFYGSKQPEGVLDKVNRAKRRLSIDSTESLDDFIVDDDERDYDEEDEDDMAGAEEDWRQELRSVLGGYDPSKYAHVDKLPDRDMEAGYNDIQKEELRSKRIAREEDAREEELERLREANKREKKRRKKGAAAFFDDD